MLSYIKSNCAPPFQSIVTLCRTSLHKSYIVQNIPYPYKTQCQVIQKQDAGNLDQLLQDVGLQAVITEFLIRCSTSVFSAVPAAPPAGHCVHCCCQCSNGTTGNKEQAAPSTKETGNNNNNHSVTFAKSPQSAATISSQYNLGSSLLKPALKTTDSVAGGQDIELRLDRPTRPRP